MSLIPWYCQKALDFPGLLHKIWIRRLRIYLKTLTIDDFQRGVNLIDNEEQLRMLWEAGLKTDQQEIVLRRLAELRRRRAGVI